MQADLKPQVWWHLILTCRGQWLPGDPRGFRSRRHRLHSRGDYQHRPPRGEHQGLFEFCQRHSAPPVTIPQTACRSVGEAMLGKAAEIEMPCLCLAAGPTHTHLLASLRDDWTFVKKQVGRLKQAGSHAIRDVLPGKVWAAGGKPIRVRDRGHHREVFGYILKHVREGAWVWRFDGEQGDPALRVAQGRLVESLIESRRVGDD